MRREKLKHLVITGMLKGKRPWRKEWGKKVGWISKVAGCGLRQVTDALTVLRDWDMSRISVPRSQIDWCLELYIYWGFLVLIMTLCPYAYEYWKLWKFDKQWKINTLIDDSYSSTHVIKSTKHTSENVKKKAPGIWGHTSRKIDGRRDDAGKEKDMSHDQGDRFINDKVQM